MNITITIPDAAIPAVQARVGKFNEGSGQPLITIQEWRQLQSDEQTAQEVAQFESDVLAALASNERLMAIGKAVAARPDKLDAVEAAVMKALS